jgi:chromosome segregation ATPase
MEFRSPLRKLVAFFRASRDKWKEKCQQAKHDLKLLKRRYATLLSSRNAWKAQCQEAEARLAATESDQGGVALS